MIELAEQLASKVGVSTACQALAVPRSSLYRARQPKQPAPSRPKPKRTLSQAERIAVRQVLNSEQFHDAPPRQVYASLLDAGTYLCHWRTMYRILKQQAEVRERRHQLKHPRYAKPELVATGPNQLWSWDGRPFGRLVNISSDMTHHQGWVSSPWRLWEPSKPKLVSFQGTSASREAETDRQDANVQERMGWG